MDPSHDASPLQVEGLSHRHGRKGPAALQDVGFALAAGRVTVLLGPNGAGKTTLLSLLMGLLPIQSGRVRLFGQDLQAAPASLRARIGLVFQGPSLEPALTGRQNLWLSARLLGMGRAMAEARIAAVLAEGGIADRADVPVRVLNGGHRRRLELARALLGEPGLLLLDEPTVGLDLPARRALVQAVQARVRSGPPLAVLWATHLIEEVQAEDDVLILARGTLVHAGPAAALPDLEAAFQRLTAPAAARADGEAAA